MPLLIAGGRRVAAQARQSTTELVCLGRLWNAHERAALDTDKRQFAEEVRRRGAEGGSLCARESGAGRPLTPALGCGPAESALAPPVMGGIMAAVSGGQGVMGAGVPGPAANLALGFTVEELATLTGVAP